MAEVDRNLVELLEFYKRFEKEYIGEMKDLAQKLNVASSSATATLGSGTKVSTKASEKITEAASKIKNAVNLGEERVRELERKIQEQLERLQDFER